MLMHANTQFQPVYRFEDFELDLQLQELRQNGSPVHIEPQVFALLALLVSNSERMIPKQELLDHVWNGRTVSDSAVNSRIRSARTILGDDGKRQRLIRTVHNRGFRFAGKLLHTAPAPAGTLPAGPAGPDAWPRAAALQQASVSDAGKTVLSIAVKPFLTRSDNRQQNLFADGIYENVIVALAKQPRLQTIALRTEKGAVGGGALQIANDFVPAFQYLLEGSIQYSAGRMRLTARLIEGATGRHVWAERYDREEDDIFALHDELTRKIVSALQTQVASGVQAETWSSGTENFSAWEALMAARELCLTHRKKPVLEGRSLAKRALALDRGYAAAWHWIAYSYWAEAKEGWGGSRERLLRQAIEAVDQGLDLQPDNANTLALLAMIQITVGKFDLALSLARRAMVMGPGNAHVFSNAGLVFLYGDRPDEAVAATRKAVEFAPMHCAGTSAILAAALWLSGDAEAALSEAEHGLHIDPEYCAIYPTMTAILVEQDRLEEAESVVEDLLRICPRFSTSAYARTHPFQNPGTLSRILTALRRSGFSELSADSKKVAV